jgi:O-antigen ligase
MLTLSAVILLAVVRPVGVLRWQCGLLIAFAGWVGLQFAMPLLQPLSSVGFSLPSRPSEFAEVVALIGYVAVPAAVAVSIRSCPDVLNRAAWPLAAMWLINVVYAFLNRLQTFDVIGITGNRNWFAATLLASAPWAAWAVYRLLHKLEPRARLIVSIIIVGPVTLWFLVLAESRASWLALALFFGLYIVWRLRERRRQLLCCAAGVVAAAGAAAALWQRLVAIQAVDVRLPLYQGTLRLIGESPVFGGGPGQFVNSVSSYLVGTGYHERIFAAEQSLHPHNELLNIAAAAGVVPALIYAVLLLGLLRNSLSESLAFRLAQFSAVIIVCQSMLDKPFVQPPSSLLVLFFIGACWTHFVPDTDELEYKGIPRLILLGTTLIFLVSAVQVAAFDARWGFHLGCAEVLSKRGEHRAALAHYERMTRMAPTRIRGPYGAGAIYIQKLAQPGQAITFLEQVHGLDPSYARVNGMIGQAYGLAGRHKEALPYLKRQAELYPYRAGPLHYYYLALYYSGRESELASVNDRVRTLYVHRPERRLRRSGFEQTVRGWESAVAGARLAEALAIADVLTQDLEGRQVDPVLNDALAPVVLPASTVWAHFNRADFEYWQMQVWRRELISEVGGGFDDLVSAVRQRVSVDEGLPFSLPMETWEKGRGSSRSIAVLSAFLCQLHWPTVLLEQGDGTLDVRCMVSGVMRGVTSVDANGLISTKSLETTIRHLQFPQQFQVKNQMLGVHADEALSDAPYGFSHTPFLKMTDDARAFGVIYSQGQRPRVVRDISEDYLRRYAVKKVELPNE